MKDFKQVNDFRNTIVESAYRGVLADAQVDEMMDEFPSYSGMSNCCGAPVLDDSDICQDCKEHCVRICPECDEGFVINRNRLSGAIDIPYTKCPNCKGTGEIE